jgi:hypothetical protein
MLDPDPIAATGTGPYGPGLQTEVAQQMAEFVISGPSLCETPVFDSFTTNDFHSLHSHEIPNPAIVRYNQALRAHFLRIREEEERHFAESI